MELTRKQITELFDDPCIICGEIRLITPTDIKSFQCPLCQNVVNGYTKSMIETAEARVRKLGCHNTAQYLKSLTEGEKNGPETREFRSDIVRDTPLRMARLARN